MSVSFGKYRVVEKIGEGGFGTVYEGWDPVLNRAVAIKTLTSPEPELRERFLREAKIAAGLQHPGITTVFDFGSENGRPYLVQELLPGEDLDEVIARRDPVSRERRIGWLIQAGRALDHAHDKDIVHRDVKPANVRLVRDDRVKILDFGIAKLLSADDGLTVAGTAMGTMGYLAPEQLLGGPVDRRADVFSFAVLVFELLSYQKPFHGDSASAVVYQVAHQDAPLLGSVWADCPDALAEMVDRCLSKAAEDRPSDLKPLIASLRAVQEGALKEGALQEGALKEGALQEGALKEGALQEGALQEGEGEGSGGALRESEEEVVVVAADPALPAPTMIAPGSDLEDGTGSIRTDGVDPTYETAPESTSHHPTRTILTVVLLLLATIAWLAWSSAPRGDEPGGDVEAGALSDGTAEAVENRNAVADSQPPDPLPSQPSPPEASPPQARPPKPPAPEYRRVETSVPGPDPDEVRLQVPVAKIPIAEDLGALQPILPEDPVSGADGPILVGGAVEEPVRVHTPAPPYEERAKRARIQGIVILQVVVSKTGEVTDVEVLKGLPQGLTQSAVRTVQSWRYTPATLNGEPVEVSMTLTFNFTLQ